MYDVIKWNIINNIIHKIILNSYTYDKYRGFKKIRYNNIARAETPIINAAANAICDAVTDISFCELE